MCFANISSPNSFFYSLFIYLLPQSDSNVHESRDCRIHLYVSSATHK